MMQTGPIIVFLGPTLPAELASRRLDALYLPPCRMGDVFRAVERHRPRAIGIVDGYFEVTPAVWHKEILYALDRGIPVFGASSMGALRASELHAFGMEGVGRIFEDFASGALTDDDEVAVVHADEADGYRAASTPMVNIRHGLQLACDAGVIGEDERESLVRALKALHYPARSWQRLWDGTAALPATRRAALRAFVTTTDCDLKAKDATALLDRMAEWDANGRPAGACVEFDFEPTVFWERLALLSRPEGGAEGADRARLLDHLRVAEPDRDAVLERALLHHLVEVTIARLGLPVPDDAAAMARFRRKRGLTSVAGLQAWMKQQGLDREACLELARHEARRRVLLRRMMPELGPSVAAILRLHDDFGRVRDNVAEVDASIAAAGITDPSPEHVTSLDEVLAWHQSRVGPIHTDLETYVAELGFGSPQQFARAMIAAYLADIAKEDFDGRASRRLA